MKKRGNETTWQEVIERNSGCTLEELKQDYNSNIIQLNECCAIIQSAIAKNMPITIIGDYDVDGVTSSSILYLTLKRLKANVTVRLPKRFSEGYGLSEKIIDEIQEGLVVTVDNGISATGSIQKAIDKGLQVVIIDHHLHNNECGLPQADVIIDPHIYPNSEFQHFCGAGLAYRVSALLVPDTEFQNQMVQLAAIGTVADVMPLIKDNRTIVRKGLKEMLTNPLPGIKKILAENGISEYCTAENIAFKVGPLLNAPGRMYDDGALISFQMLIATSWADACTIYPKLFQANEERKIATEQGVITAEALIDSQCLYGDSCFVLYHPSFFEGVCGIIAGKIAEKYNTTTFILTDVDNNMNKIKGSGRSIPNVHIKKILDKCAPIHPSIGYGGHEAAAGLSIDKDDLFQFDGTIQKEMNEWLENAPSLTEKESEYDLVLDLQDVPAVIKQIAEYEPFGEGCRPPVFRIVINPQLQKNNKYYTTMKADGMKFICDYNVSALMFGLSSKYLNAKSPKKLDVIGTISNNYFSFNGKVSITPQILIHDFEPIKEEVKISPFAAMLADKAKIR